MSLLYVPKECFWPSQSDFERFVALCETSEHLLMHSYYHSFCPLPSEPFSSLLSCLTDSFLPSRGFSAFELHVYENGDSAPWHVDTDDPSWKKTGSILLKKSAKKGGLELENLSLPPIYPGDALFWDVYDFHRVKNVEGYRASCVFQLV